MILFPKSPLISAFAGLAMLGATSGVAFAGGGGWNGQWNAPLVAGAVGGLAVGALVAGARPLPPPPPPVYVDQYAGPPVYCHWERRPVFDAYGEYIGSQPVRICQ
jgi:hypothetical protein